MDLFPYRFSQRKQQNPEAQGLASRITWHITRIKQHVDQIQVFVRAGNAYRLIIVPNSFF